MSKCNLPELADDSETQYNTCMYSPIATSMIDSPGMLRMQTDFTQAIPTEEYLPQV